MAQRHADKATGPSLPSAVLCTPVSFSIYPLWVCFSFSPFDTLSFPIWFLFHFIHSLFASLSPLFSLHVNSLTHSSFFCAVRILEAFQHNLANRLVSNFCNTWLTVFYHIFNTLNNLSRKLLKQFPIISSWISAFWR